MRNDTVIAVSVHWTQSVVLSWGLSSQVSRPSNLAARNRSETSSIASVCLAWLKSYVFCIAAGCKATSIARCSKPDQFALKTDFCWHYRLNLMRVGPNINTFITCLKRVGRKSNLLFKRPTLWRVLPYDEHISTHSSSADSTLEQSLAQHCSMYKQQKTERRQQRDQS